MRESCWEWAQMTSVLVVISENVRQQRGEQPQFLKLGSTNKTAHLHSWNNNEMKKSYNLTIAEKKVLSWQMER